MGRPSLWQRGGLDGRDLACEVAVVGGGIAGVSAALTLQRAGVDAVLVESRQICDGASGRNAGFLMRGAAENYAAACRAYGRERARLVWKWTEENLAELRAEGVESTPGYARRPSCLVATDAEEAGELVESTRLLAEDGFDAALIRPGEPGVPDDAIWRSGRPIVGLLNPHDAVCHSVEVVSMLARKLDRTRVIERQPIEAIGGEQGGVRLVTVRGEIVAKRVLVCVNAWAGTVLPALAGLVTPNRGQMLALRPEDPRDAELAYAYYLHHGHEYTRSVGDGLVIFGGARGLHAAAERGFGEEPTGPVQGSLEAFARELISPRFGVVARWAGTMGFSQDGLPLVGPVDHAGVEPGRVWFCGGFTGHGMSMAFRTARAAVGEMLGGEATPFPLGRC
jgi:glycine/D-amino acid oxidase-like deaminating enzyme